MSGPLRGNFFDSHCTYRLTLNKSHSMQLTNDSIAWLFLIIRSYISASVLGIC